MVRDLLGVCLFLSIGVSATRATADVIHVPADHASIQTAISAASDGDEIVVSPGTYYEAIDFLGKAIMVRSIDPLDTNVIAETVIDGSYEFTSTVHCVNGETPQTVLDGVTVTGGIGSALLWGEDFRLGGGMFVHESNPTVRHCVFRDNEAAAGGGMYVSGGGATISGCMFKANEATGFQGISPLHGGGGFTAHFADVRLDRCVCLDNYTESKGGGIYLLSPINSVVTNCLVSGNSADNGGGIHLRDASTLIVNTTIVANHARIFANYVGDGIYNWSHSGAQPVIINCVVTDNSSPGDYQEIADAPDPLSIVEYSFVQGGWNGSGGNNLGDEPWQDPAFIDPANGDFRLGPDSSCINVGDSDAVPPEIELDLDGRDRIVNAIVDMGAYECQQIIEPVGACCLTDGACIEVSADECWGSGGTYQGDTTLCEEANCAPPTGACCLSDGSCIEVSSDECSSSGGAYQGDASLCAEADCALPTGACCFGSGACEDLAEVDCFDAGGVFQGDGTDCGSSSCPQPTGACCLADGECLGDLTSADCASEGGTFQGIGSTCSDVECTVAEGFGACCFYPGGECLELSHASCLAAGGVFQGDGSTCEETECVQQPPGPDLNEDGYVNVADLLILLAAWGQCPTPPAECPADLNGDGSVDVMDLLELLSHWD
jgi:hypothetical protein